MKSLKDILLEAEEVKHNFKSKIVENAYWWLLDRFTDKPDMPKWDEITDDDLEELPYHEIDYWCSRIDKKEAPYVILLSNHTFGVDTGKVALITWKRKVVWCAKAFIRTEGVPVKSVLRQIDYLKAYKLKDPEKFINK